MLTSNEEQTEDAVGRWAESQLGGSAKKEDPLAVSSRGRTITANAVTCMYAVHADPALKLVLT